MDKEERVMILGQLHGERSQVGRGLQAQAIAGHSGRDITRQRVRERYYWPDWCADVDEFVRTCDLCQSQKKNSGVVLKARVDYRSTSIPYGNPWSLVGIDLMGPLALSDGEYKYIMTVICYYTKYVELVALKSKSGIDVGQSLFEVFCRQGFPNAVITDQGKEFVNQLSEYLYKQTDVHHRITSAYHPQANGLVERQNHTTMNKMRTLISNKCDQDKWRQLLPPLQMCINSTKHRMTGYTPFQLMTTRQMRLPIDAGSRSEGEQQADFDDEEYEKIVEAEQDEFQEGVFTAALEIKEGLNQKAETISRKARKMTEINYRKKHNQIPTVELKVGDKVYRKNKRNEARAGGKQDTVWHKTVYQVVSINSRNGLFTLKDLKKGKVFAQQLPAEHLKLQIDRPSHLKRSTEISDGEECSDSDWQDEKESEMASTPVAGLGRTNRSIVESPRQTPTPIATSTQNMTEGVERRLLETADTSHGSGMIFLILTIKVLLLVQLVQI